MLVMLILAAAAAPQSAPATSGPPCHMKGIEILAPKPDKAVRLQKLNELPNADAYLTVLRRDENGCNKPVIVSYDIGSAPKKQR